MYISTKELPAVVQRVLKEHGYNKTDINVKPKEQVSVGCGSMKGQRSYTVIINLETEETRTYTGSWGGPNMFNPDNRVDLDHTPHTIPLNCAVVQGSEGYYSYANLYLHPENMQRFLPASPVVSDVERSVLRAYHEVRAGAYRKEALLRIAGSQEAMNTLINRGFLKQSKNGACRITTEGKNALYS